MYRNPDYKRHWYQKNKGRIKEQNLLRRYGFSVAEYDEMLAKQNGCCALCGCAPSVDKALGVDHDHVTGVIRGLLCDPCNKALGLLRDDPALMVRAAEYVRRSRRDDPDMPDLGERN